MSFAADPASPIERIRGVDQLVRTRVSQWRHQMKDDLSACKQADRWLSLLRNFAARPAAKKRQILATLLAEIQALSEPNQPDAPPAPRKKARAMANSKAVTEAITLQSPVTCLPGVGPGRMAKLAKLNIRTLDDLLLHLPTRYEDRREITPLERLQIGDTVTVRARLVSVALKPTARRGFSIVDGAITDDEGLGGLVVVRWFNQAHRARQLKVDDLYLFCGKVGADRGGQYLVLENPSVEPWQEGADTMHSGRVVPIYPATAGVTPTQLRSWMAWTLARVTLPEPLPAALRKQWVLPERATAFHLVHRPETMEQPDQGIRRLAFEEFFCLQLGLALRQRGRQVKRTGIAIAKRPGTLEARLRKALPFGLTGAQTRVLGEIRADLARGVPMHRLLQGDVGCGKTVVALLTLLAAIDHGYQGALMAPTEVLAEQHYRKLQQLLDGLPVEVVLLTGAVQGKKKRLDRIAQGDVALVVGTQALIQDKVTFAKLGLVVIDEQHRFGVRQRASLGNKGAAPHILAMTATPIPRSLAMTLYGDLDLSVIDELPPGRTPIKTKRFGEGRRQEVYRTVRQQVEAGHQAYIVYPLVEASEKVDLRDATAAYEELQAGPLHGLRLGLLHGRMKTEQKLAVTGAFSRGELQVLVTTTAVEVGLDVPAATVMVVEHAERFGLAQLHQLRGRVGRGEHASVCLLVAGVKLTTEGRARLQALVDSQDGFVIAERDLTIRGPGEMFGPRQSGLPELKVANLLRDGVLLTAAREAARQLLEADPDLDQPSHQLLRGTVTRLWRHHLKWGAVG